MTLFRLVLVLLITLMVACSGDPEERLPDEKPAAPSSKDAEPPENPEEFRELSTPEAKPYASAEREIGFLRRFKLGASLEEVRAASPENVKLGAPTTELPIGELPDDRVVVEFKGDLRGFFYFTGSAKQVGKLVRVEVFAENGSYRGGPGKRRIKSLVKYLGKPMSAEKYDEDAGTPLYSAEWREGEEIISYADTFEWGSTLALEKGDND